MKLFDIKRTKMIDEAAFMHRPSSFGKTFWPFLLLVFICDFIASIIVGIVGSIYDTVIYIKDGTYEAMVNAMGEGQSFMDVFSTYMSDVTIPWWLDFVTLFSYGITIAGVIFYCLKIEKRPLSSLGFRKNGVVLEILLGLGIGALLIGAVYAIVTSTGAVTFVRHTDTRILRPSIILYFFGFLVKVVSEELLYRGFLLTSLSRDIRPIFSALLTALVCSIFNFSTLIGFINSFVFCFLLNVYVLKRGSIWGSISIRFVWCFFEAVVLGFTGLGAAMFLPATPTSSVSLLLAGTPGYGFDSGLIATILFIFTIFILLLLKTKKSERSCVEVEYFN